MYYVNTAGHELNISYKNQKYNILGWAHIELPDDMYEYLAENYPEIELDYDLLIDPSFHSGYTWF